MHEIYKEMGSKCIDVRNKILKEVYKARKREWFKDWIWIQMLGRRQITMSFQICKWKYYT